MVPLPTLRVPTPRTANPYLANPSRRKPLWLPLPFSAVSQRETKRNTEAIWGGGSSTKDDKKKHSFLKLVQTGSYGLVWLEHLLVWSASSLGWTPPGFGDPARPALGRRLPKALVGRPTRPRRPRSPRLTPHRGRAPGPSPCACRSSRARSTGRPRRRTTRPPRLGSWMGVGFGVASGWAGILGGLGLDG